MEDRLRFVKYKDQEFLLIDLTGADTKEVLNLLPEIQATVTEKPRGSVLVLADFSGAQIDKTVATRLKEVLVFDRPFVKRSAWVGTENLPQVFYEGFKQFSQRDFPKFKTREEGMEWLVTE